MTFSGLLLNSKCSLGPATSARWTIGTSIPMRTGIISLPRASTITSDFRFFPVLGDLTGRTGLIKLTNAPGVGFRAFRPFWDTNVPRR